MKIIDFGRTDASYLTLKMIPIEQFLEGVGQRKNKYFEVVDSFLIKDIVTETEYRRLTRPHGVRRIRIPSVVSAYTQDTGWGSIVFSDQELRNLRAGAKDSLNITEPICEYRDALTVLDGDITMEYALKVESGKIEIGQIFVPLYTAHPKKIETPVLMRKKRSDEKEILLHFTEAERGKGDHSFNRLRNGIIELSGRDPYRKGPEQYGIDMVKHLKVHHVVQSEPPRVESKYKRNFLNRFRRPSPAMSNSRVRELLGIKPRRFSTYTSVPRVEPGEALRNSLGIRIRE